MNGKTNRIRLFVVTIVVIIIALFGLLALSKWKIAKADEAQQTIDVVDIADQCQYEADMIVDLNLAPVAQIETFVVLPEPTQAPVYKPMEDLPKYNLNNEEVEILAKLLWSSPLRNDFEKSKLLWVVFSRVDHGCPFKGTIKECVTKSEFSFYDEKAHISDRNRELVKYEMTRWLAMKEGYGIGPHPPKNALYCRFVGKYNRSIDLLSDVSGRALKW